MKDCKGCGLPVRRPDANGYCMTPACTRASELEDRLDALEAQLDNATLQQLADADKLRTSEEQVAWLHGLVQSREKLLEAQDQKLAALRHELLDIDAAFEPLAARFCHDGAPIVPTLAQMIGEAVEVFKEKDLELIKLRERVRKLEKSNTMLYHYRNHGKPS